MMRISGQTRSAANVLAWAFLLLLCTVRAEETEVVSLGALRMSVPKSWAAARNDEQLANTARKVHEMTVAAYQKQKELYDKQANRDGIKELPPLPLFVETKALAYSFDHDMMLRCDLRQGKDWQETVRGMEKTATREMAGMKLWKCTVGRTAGGDVLTVEGFLFSIDEDIGQFKDAFAKGGLVPNYYAWYYHYGNDVFEVKLLLQGNPSTDKRKTEFIAHVKTVVDTITFEPPPPTAQPSTLNPEP